MPTRAKALAKVELVLIPRETQAVFWRFPGKEVVNTENIRSYQIDQRDRSTADRACAIEIQVNNNWGNESYAWRKCHRAELCRR